MFKYTHSTTEKKFLGITPYQWACLLYVAVAVFCWQWKYFRHINNNYLIFQQSYYHASRQLNLYAQYPAEYYDVFLYGPLFAIFIAPFAILSESIGFLFWELCNTAAFLLAVHLLPFNFRIKTAILLVCAIEFANSAHYMEFNPFIAATIILSFIMVRNGKEEWATLLIISGALMKIYPIVGLAFFIFSKRKGQFVMWSIIWSVICIGLPILLFDPMFVFQSYADWLAALSAKNLLNVNLSGGQDWCIMGVARRLLHDATLPNWPFLLAGTAIFTMPLLRFKQYDSLIFQLQIMCSALLIVVLFSTGSEHPTFIIASVGAAVYILMQPKPFGRVNMLFLILLIVITGLGPTDAFPLFIRVPMNNLAMKAWPCIAIWLKIAYELIFNDFRTAETKYLIMDRSPMVLNRISNSTFEDPPL